MASLLKQNGSAETFHFVDHTVGGATFQAILQRVADASTMLRTVDWT